MSSDGLRSWPLGWKSKRQGSTASSTCESEVISATTALKTDALPMLDLLESALGRTVHLQCREDNTQCIQAAETGYSKALGHLSRTERISLGVLHEVFVEQTAGSANIQYQETASHKGDMFTKRLDPGPFEEALKRINLLPPARAQGAPAQASKH